MTTERQATIVGTRRLKLSAAGNPRIVLRLDDGTEAQTQDNGAINYAIENREWHGVPVILSLTKSGRVWAVRHSLPWPGI